MLVVLATLWYLPWVLANLNRQALWLSLPFAASSVMTAVTTIITVINHWHHRAPEEHVVPSGAEPTVVVIIPTFGEPPSMVYETAKSVLEQDYPLDRIRLVISDDAHREGIRLVVKRLQGERPSAFVFYHEPLRRGDYHRRGEGKAGNLNSVLDTMPAYAPEVEFVETRDADDTVGDKAFLRKTLGQLLADPKVAFVQTIKEAVTSPSDPFGNREPLLYRRAMLARHAANAVFPCGSGLVWRLAALNDIGGFPSWNPLEDLQSGVEALRRGWRGVYLPIVGAVAQTAPEDIPNTIKQRGTWALDTMRLIFWGEKRGLSLAQRLQFAELGLFYLVSFAAFVFAMTPAFPLFFGIYPLTTNQAQYAIHFWPYAIAIELLLISLAWGLPYEALLRSRQMWLGMAPVYMRATIVALRFGPTRKPSYRVTRKDQVYAWYWRAILPQLALFVLLLVAATYHVMTHPLLSEADLGSLFWAGFFVLGLSRIVRNSWHGIAVGKRPVRAASTGPPGRDGLLPRLRLSPASPRQQAFTPRPTGTDYQPNLSGPPRPAPSPDLPGQGISRATGGRRRSRTVYWSLVAAATVVALVVLTARWGYYQLWQPMTHQQAELHRIRLSAQAYQDVATGDYAAAEQNLRTLLTANPADEQVQKRIAEAQRQAALSASYVKIQEAIAQENWGQAELLLAELAQREVDSETVQAWRAFKKARQTRGALFLWGEQAYQAGDWIGAAVTYEMLQRWDAEYRGQAVVEHLVDSYVRQGVFLVERTRGDTNAVQQAIELYRQALLLQPEQPEAMRELGLAEKYLEGRDLLARNDLRGALHAWQWVYQQDPNYDAGGLAVFFKFVDTGAPPVASSAIPGGQ